jgi:peptidylprolyl isomerase
MKYIAIALCFTGIVAAAAAQTPAAQTPPVKTAPKTAASGSTAAKTSTASTTTATTTTAKSSSTAAADASPWIKLPPNVPRVVHGPVKVAIAARYEDIKVGTGPEAEPNKMWHIKYTGWRAADGIKFDSWDDHPQPVVGKDGKPELGPDGKPKMGDPQPMAFPQGMGRLIPGFDYDVAGMHVGGKRRLFIPWQLAYGVRGVPDRPDHPGIPPKSDLIFDVELVEVTDMPAPPVMPVRPPTGVPGAAPAPRPAAPPAPGTAPGTAPAAATPPPAPTTAPGATTPPPAPQPATPPPLPTTQPQSK